jgi:hypothetical protein
VIPPMERSVARERYLMSMPWTITLWAIRWNVMVILQQLSAMAEHDFAMATNSPPAAARIVHRRPLGQAILQEDAHTIGFAPAEPP